MLLVHYLKMCRLPMQVQIMSYPHTTFRFERMGKGDKGGKQYRIDDEFYIDVNVDSDWAVEPLVRHEVSHYLEAVGGLEHSMIS